MRIREVTTASFMLVLPWMGGDSLLVYCVSSVILMVAAFIAAKPPQRSEAYMILVTLFTCLFLFIGDINITVWALTTLFVGAFASRLQWKYASTTP